MTATACILGLSPTGLYAVRELARAGIRVYGFENQIACGHGSGYLGYGARAHICRDDESLLRRLSAVAMGCEEPPMLLPSSDQYIEFMARHRDVLEPRFRMHDCYKPETVGQIMDKASFYGLCQSHGMPAPETRVCQTEALAEVEAEFPLLLKPALIHEVRGALGQSKAFFIRHRRELIDRAAALPAGATWLLQALVPGPESNIRLVAVYMDASGEMRQCFTARKLRQYPPGFGSASCVLSEDHADMRRHTEVFLKAIGHRGYAGVEYKLDEAGQPWMIEINMRPSLWFQIALDAGRQVMLAGYRDLCGLEPLPEQPQANGLVWRYGLKDLATQLHYWRRTADPLPPPRPAPLGRLRSWPVWSGRDPLPALFELLVYATKGGRRVVPFLTRISKTGK